MNELWKPELEDAFPANYTIEVRPQLPQRLEKVRFVPANSSGPILHVVPLDGESWTGVFRVNTKGARLLTTPNPHEFAIFSKSSSSDRRTEISVGSGDAWFVDAQAGAYRQIGRGTMIEDALAVPEFGLLLFYDDQMIWAFDRDGLRWERHVGLNSLEIRKRVGAVLEVSSYLPHGPSYEGVSLIDVRTGEIRVSR